MAVSTCDCTLEQYQSWESAPKTASRRKIPWCTGEPNPHQQCAIPHAEPTEIHTCPMHMSLTYFPTYSKVLRTDKFVHKTRRQTTTPSLNWAFVTLMLYRLTVAHTKSHPTGYTSLCLLGEWARKMSTPFVTVHEKTRYKSKIAILDNAHLKVQTLCYFMLK